jgi:hypothetical protein
MPNYRAAEGIFRVNNNLRKFLKGHLGSDIISINNAVTAQVG